ncbi:MAG: DNA mismatch repair protein MutS [Bacteroidetes bacterium]|nr:DNA mismatch repair protein MutS [Bacteroidota bacterium]
MAKSSGDTPLMQQHRSIKAKYPDAILLFRVGDFYETFGQDAVHASRVLGITLTKRNNGAASESELAGFPHHALDTYVHKLVKAGFRVAICDQLEDPKQAKGIVKRGVTELLTPGIATNEKLLDLNSNNFLAAVHFEREQFGLAFLDMSTGEFLVAGGNKEEADKLLQSLRPAEIIFARPFQKLFRENFGEHFYTYQLDEWIFQETYTYELLLKHFETHSLKGFGIEASTPGTVAAGAILHYLRDTEHPNIGHITALKKIQITQHLWMDRFSVRNLELVDSGQTNGATLLKAIDHTVSPMGARLLRRWILLPLKEKKGIEERLDTVEYLIQKSDWRTELRQLIKQCGDMERLVAKLPLKKMNPREVLHLAKSLELTALIKESCSRESNTYLQRLSDTINPCTFIAEKIIATLEENAPVTVQKGQVIRQGVNADLDELRNIARNGKEYLLSIQQRESESTGIPSLKIAYNQVFGYYLEVTHTHRSKVPDNWIRKQTLTNAERYITPELKEYEEKITGAEEKILQIETALFEQLLLELQAYIIPIQQNAQVLSILDCLSTFAENALRYHYCKPDIHEGEALTITAGRHPVIEQQLPPGEPYISNDLQLDQEAQQIIILTGPNMSGKSALLRQTGLIVLMAHMGSYVPASAASIPLTDKIFTRVGASDNLSGGESTFMVEMNETASIINNLSRRSLVLLDEIGRGTSTYDGISIAWSIAEFLHQCESQPKTLFATHYHELNELEEKCARIKNYHVSNQEVGNKIVFLRKLVKGGSVHSFGIHVARMAGMPPELISRANEILQQLEAQRTHPVTEQTLKAISAPKMQLSIFDVHSQTFDDIRKLLENLDINRLTPVEALLKLQEIKSKLK